MSSSVPDPDPVSQGVEQDKQVATSEEIQKPQDNQLGLPETPKDTPLPSTAAAETANGNDVSTKKEDAGLTVPKAEQKSTTNTGEQPIPAASTRSKNSSLTKTLSNGKLFNRKGNGDGSKREAAPVIGTAAGSTTTSGAGDEKAKTKKKKKRTTIWRFLNSCFTPSIDHTVLDDSKSASSADPVVPANSKATKALSEKKIIGDHAAEPSGSATLASTGKQPPTPSRRSSGAPVALAAGDELVVPPAEPDLLPLAETEGVTSGAVQAPGSTGVEGSDSESSVVDEDRHRPLEEEDDEERLILNGGNGIPIGPDGKEAPLLPPLAPALKGRKCLVLDLDETLVHSSFKLIPQADYVVPVEIEWQWHNVYVIKRPGVDAFLKRMGELYEVVIFTASLSKYADPVLDKLDVHKVVSHRLFRESCYLHKGNYVKDLSQLGRPIGETIILDNSPASYIFHPNNAVPVSSWFNDPHDTELTDMSPFLADLTEVSDIRGVLDGGV